MFTRYTHVLPAAAAVVAAALLLAGAAACGGDPPAATSSASLTSPAGSAPAAGTKLAPGLYDLAGGGVVQAIGTVEYRDLEGGFWVVIGGTEAEGDAGRVVAVIANGADFADQFAQHPGLSFIVDGARLDGASTRMAGPEITATRVTLAGDGGPAE